MLSMRNIYVNSRLFFMSIIFSNDGSSTADIQQGATLDVPDVNVTIMRFSTSGSHLIAGGEGSNDYFILNQ